MVRWLAIAVVGLSLALPACSGGPPSAACSAYPGTSPVAYVVADQTGANTSQASVVPIQTATNLACAAITVATNETAGAILMAPDGKMAYVFLDDGGVVPIQTATDTVGQAINNLSQQEDLGFGVITPDGRTLYVMASDNNGHGGVTPVRTTTGRVGRTISVASPLQPSSAVVTPDGKTLYVLSTFGEMVTPVSTATNRAGNPIKVGTKQSQDPSIAVTPDGKTVYVGVARMVVPIRASTAAPGKPIHVARHVLAVAAAPGGKVVYVSTRDSVVPIRTATNTAGNPIQGLRVGFGPYAIKFAPNGRTTFVLSADGKLTWIRTASGTVIRSILLPPCPGAGYPGPPDMAVTADGKTLYLVPGCPDLVIPVHVATGRLGTPISVVGAVAIAIGP